MVGGRDASSIKADSDPSIARLCETYDALLDDDSAVATSGPGSDLAALAQIYDIAVDRPAGEVWADLRAFLVRQPVRVDAPSEATTADDVRLTILVVEDDPDMAEDLVAALTDAGHNVVGPFYSAEAAEVSAAHRPIDIALLDINLSGVGTGADLAETVRSRWGVSSIFLSGDVTSAARHARSAQAILVKPIVCAKSWMRSLIRPRRCDMQRGQA